jgi:polyhydroxybutyrate depolymerase
MGEKSDAAGFIAVHPLGTGSSKSWNGGACCGEAASKPVDDVQFVRDLLDEVATRICVDDKRVFATGMSNGGFLSHRLACELSDRIAAIAPVAGVLGVKTCSPKRAVPVMHFHGTADSLVPYAGNADFPSVEEMMAAWAARDGCASTPATSFEKGDTKCRTWSGCATGSLVTLCTVDGGGHTWPGGLPIPTGKTTTAISATDAMWTFFVDHPMP